MTLETLLLDIHTEVERYGEIRNPQIVDGILDYLKDNPSIGHEKIRNIKKLTKAATRLNESYELSEDTLEKLYIFNLEGAIKARLELEQIKDAGNLRKLIIMKSHFYSHAGDAARSLFTKTGKLFWANRGYTSYKASAHLASRSDRKHSAYAFGIAGETAAKMHKNSGEIGDKVIWGERSYIARITSAELLKGFNKGHSANAYKAAGDMAARLAKITMQETWAERAIGCYDTFLQTYSWHPFQEIGELRDARNKVEHLQSRFNLAPSIC